jgi:hypothetical protein
MLCRSSSPLFSIFFVPEEGGGEGEEELGRRIRAGKMRAPGAFCAGMKVALLVSSFFALTLAVSAQETAYNALRVVGRAQGKEAMNQVLEVRGRAGSPQPTVWKVTLNEPRARGGIREVDVQKGKIIAERTPSSSRIAGAPMNFTQLNLDSDGAFTIANQEAQKLGIPFDQIDYLLRSGTGGGAPVWQLELSDTKLGRAGGIDIAADTGAILAQRLVIPTGAKHPPIVDRREPPPPPPNNNGGKYSQPGEPFRGVDDFFHRLGKRFQKRGVQLENFFTGKGGQGAPSDDDDR